MSRVVPVSVIVPTIGRLPHLEACLSSLRSCSPRANEVLVVDQSAASSTKDLVLRFTDIGARVVPCTGWGPSRARNCGLHNAHHDVVLLTDDDCTVSESWVENGWELMRSDGDRIVSGRTIARGDPDRVPATKNDPSPREYVGKPRIGALHSNNMVAQRAAVLAIGGFDEHLLAAEDVDLGYRWIRAGGRISYAPELVLWHTDWRTDEELEHLSLAYSYGGGMFHAKHLRQGDWRVLPSFVSDALRAGRDLIRRPIAPRHQSWWDESRVFTSGYLEGLRAGWRIFGAQQTDVEDSREMAGDPHGVPRDA